MPKAVHLLSASIDTIAMGNSMMPFYGKSLLNGTIEELSKGNIDQITKEIPAYANFRLTENSYREFIGYVGAYYETQFFREIEYVVKGTFCFNCEYAGPLAYIYEFHFADAKVSKRLFASIRRKDLPPSMIPKWEHFARYRNRLYYISIYESQDELLSLYFLDLLKYLDKNWYPPF